MSLQPLDQLLGSDEADRAAVQVLRWPAESGRRDPGRPCLWLLALGELPPIAVPGDDWVRVPVDDRDLRARLQRLAGRTAAPDSLAPGEVAVDLDGRVDRCGASVHLPPIEAHILTELAAVPERVVTRAALESAVWGSDGPGGRALDSRIHSLRHRLGPLGLAVHTIRGRGFLLTTCLPATDS